MNLGELSKPLDTLVKKVFSAGGILYEPTRIRKKAKAESDALITQANTQMEIIDIQRRGIHRLILEEGIKQDNIENIIATSFPLINEDAKPEDIEDDWIANFFDKCKLISDDSMQELWAKVLAGEANTPGQYSKRTINLLASLDKYDAELFTSLCTFSWKFKGIDNVFIIISYLSNEILLKRNIISNTLNHLENIGLITYNHIDPGNFLGVVESIDAFYFDQIFHLKFPNKQGNSLPAGDIVLSKTGKELMSVCSPEHDEEYKKFIIKVWQKEDIIVGEIKDKYKD